MRPTPDTRDSYPHFLTLGTRWADNDVYGHVNNSVYYYYLDTVVNRWLLEEGLLKLEGAEIIGLVVNTGLDYFESLAFPEDVHLGLRVGRIGSSSVRYEVGIFGASQTAAAQGHFVHVYVDAKTRKPVPLPEAWREALDALTD